MRLHLVLTAPFLLLTLSGCGYHTLGAAGEPFRLFFTPETLEMELRRAGFRRFEQVDSDRLNEHYFKERADGLKLSAVKLGMLVTAWVGG
jgi:hypothetical protein